MPPLLLTRAGGALAATTIACIAPIAAPAQAAPTASTPCQATGTHLSWGIKTTWRSYITGIANGDWSTSGGASYSTPNFTWPTGRGTVTEPGPTGSVTFPGSVHFTGHEGQLDTTMENPTVVLSGSSAHLDLDFTSSVMKSAMDGDATITHFGRIPFADIDMSKATTTRKGDQNVITVTDAPTAITATAAKDFSSFYPARTAFDPISFQISVPASCGTSTTKPATAPGTGTTPASPTSTGARPTAAKPVSPTTGPRPAETKPATTSAPTPTAGTTPARGNTPTEPPADTTTAPSDTPAAANRPAEPTGAPTSSSATAGSSTDRPASNTSSPASMSSSTKPSTPPSRTPSSTSTDSAAPLAAPQADAPTKSNHTAGIMIGTGIGLCAALGLGAAVARYRNRS